MGEENYVVKVQTWVQVDVFFGGWLNGVVCSLSIRSKEGSKKKIPSIVRALALHFYLTGFFYRPISISCNSHLSVLYVHAMFTECFRLALSFHTMVKIASLTWILFSNNQQLKNSNRLNLSFTKNQITAQYNSFPYELNGHIKTDDIHENLIPQINSHF